MIDENYINIEIGSLMGNKDLPKYLKLRKDRSRYKYIREKLDRWILENRHCKIDYNLLSNGKMMEDWMEYSNGKVIVVPKVETGFRVDKESRSVFIPMQKRLVFKRRLLRLPAIKKKEYIDIEKYKEDNIKTRNILNNLKKKRLEKKRRLEILKMRRKFKPKDNYCGLKWGFLLLY